MLKFVFRADSALSKSKTIRWILLCFGSAIARIWGLKISKLKFSLHPKGDIVFVTKLKLTLCCIFLLGSLKRNKQLGEFTQSKVEGSISKWLTGSRDRNGGRVERTKVEKEKAEKRRRED